MKKLFLVLSLVLALPLAAQRLPGNAVPESYDLTFTPDFASNSFAGQAAIKLKLLQPSSTIVLNAAEIEFADTMVHLGKDTHFAKVTLDEEKQQATLTFEHELPAGPVLLHIHYKGKLNDKLRGFYLSTHNGRKYAVTQFESTDARRAFPSFDEPAYKATFAITLVIPADDTAISNGKIISDTPGPKAGEHTVKFSTTPKMSTYLVAMAVGDFKCNVGAAGDIPIRICATPDKVKLTDFALTSAEHIMTYYNKYYGIPYPFEKLDVVAVPDFEAGAMENTAAIFYRETALLIDDPTASVDAHQTVAEVLAHEMAHMWFGDLVTMAWWDDIWLNEGFASWMTRKPVAAWKPEWNLDIESAQATAVALNTDSLRNTRPIRQHADTPQQIDQLFDGIAYGKTASMLRMVESYLGEETFRKGVNQYISEHAYGNATAQDFWNTMAKVSGKPVDKILSSYVTQPGAPLVSVESSCRSGKTTVKLSQQRFFYESEAMAKPSAELWNVPVCFDAPSLKGKAAVCHVLTQRSETFQLEGGCSPWLFANASGRGHYRTEYTSASVEGLSGALSGGLLPQERTILVGDEWALVRSNRRPVGEFLNVAWALRDERLNSVAEVMLERLEAIDSDIAVGPARDSFRAFVRSMLRPAAERMGWEPKAGETDDQFSLRARVLLTLGRTGRDEETLASARKIVDRALKGEAVEPNAGETAFRLAGYGGDAGLYERIYASLKSARNPEEYYRSIRSLNSFSQPALVKKSFELFVSPEFRNQDSARRIAQLMENDDARDQAWELVKSRWPEVQAKFTTSSGRAVIGATNGFCDAQHRDEVQQFFAAHKVAAGERTLTRSLEYISACMALRSQQTENLTAWLKQHPEASGGTKNAAPAN